MEQHEQDMSITGVLRSVCFWLQQARTSHSAAMSSVSGSAGIYFATRLCIVQGQPALLYLVPCTLGTVVLLAWLRGDLPSMWQGNVTEAALSRVSSHKDSDAESAPDMEAAIDSDGGFGSQFGSPGDGGQEATLLEHHNLSSQPREHAPDR